MDLFIFDLGGVILGNIGVEAEASASTITSLGPASMSIDTKRLASIFAKETNLLPGPKILFLFSTLSVPYANAAIA